MSFIRTKLEASRLCCDHERECDDNVGKFTHKLDVEFMDVRIDALQIDFFFYSY